MFRFATSLLVMLAAGCGGSDSGGGSGGSSGSGGASGGAGGTVSTGGNGGVGGGADAGDCAALKTDLDAKLAEAATCFAGTNPSTCEIVQDGLCNCAAVNTASGGVDYLAAAKAYKAAGCTVSCPGVVCPSTAACKAPGPGQGTCQPNF